MRDFFFSLVLLLFWAACGYAQSNSYVFVWAGDDSQKSRDFLAVLDADAKSRAMVRRWHRSPFPVQAVHLITQS
jgi:hypothetical protein